MAFVRAKVKKGGTYYYLVESKRTGKSVKQQILEYIGPVEKLMKFAADSYNALSEDTPSFKVYTHGSGMAMYYAAQFIGIEEILNSVFPPKTIKGLARSRVLLLAMIHRAIDPSSKRAFAGWAETTSLPYHLSFKAEDLDSQSFWEAMDGISEEEILEAQRRITERLFTIYQVNPTSFHLDYTNYFTFIDSKNERCVICSRGHNKQKRDDLRQFSLAMLTSYALQVPLIWELYEGNKNDKSEFSDFTQLVRKELDALNINMADITLIFDGGSNSEETFRTLGCHVICAHSLSGHKYLYDIDIDEYEKVILEDGHERHAYRVDEIEFSGLTGTGILTYSEALKKGQEAQMDRDMASVQGSVNEVNEKINNHRSKIWTSLRKTKAETERAIKEAGEYNKSLEKESMQGKGRRKKAKTIPVWDEEKSLSEIVSNMIYKRHKYISEFTEIRIISDDDGNRKAALFTDEAARAAYIRKYYGKKLTCTDHRDWTTVHILSEYNQQECIENGIFKTSKDVDHFAVRPQYHWTDDKIAVHTFLCLTALTITEVLRMELEKHDIHMTKHALLDKLSEIHDGWVFRSEKKADRILEKLDDEHQHLWNAVLSLKQG